MHGVFVTGTDTGIGKTVVSSLLVSALRPDGEIGYWKPVQTGIEQDDDTAEVRRLAQCSPAEMHDAGVRLRLPLSPHLSARLAGRTIAIARLLEIASTLDSDRFWIVEGAGGLLVPLNDQETLVDLIARLGLPTAVAARTGLGTINHTLLTLEALRRRSLRVAGVVLVGEPNRENRRAIEQYGAIEVLAEVPPLDPLDASAVAALARRLRPGLQAALRGNRPEPGDRSHGWPPSV